MVFSTALFNKNLFHSFLIFLPKTGLMERGNGGAQQDLKLGKGRHRDICRNNTQQKDTWHIIVPQWNSALKKCEQFF